jgi:hypothetical protein
MPNANELADYYRSLTDPELLHQVSEGGFTDEAEKVLSKELERRHLGRAEATRYAADSEKSKLRDEVVERGGGYRGLGMQFFGRAHLNEADERAGIQVRTKWFTISGIPLIPVASYRFRCAGVSGKRRGADLSHSVIDRVPLHWTQVFATWMKSLILLIGGILLVVGAYWLLDRGRH